MGKDGSPILTYNIERQQLALAARASARAATTTTSKQHYAQQALCQELKNTLHLASHDAKMTNKELSISCIYSCSHNP